MEAAEIARATRLTAADRRAVAAGQRRLEGKLARLRGIVPHIVDLSCREASLPASFGHTLDDKKELLALAREFGFTDVAVANFFDFVNIDEAFARDLRDSGDSMDGTFANVMVAKTRADRPLAPGYGLRRIAEIGIPNVLMLMEIRPRTIARAGRRAADVFRDIAQSVAHLREVALPRPSARRGRIYARFLDIFDAWDEDPGIVVQTLKLLAALPVNAVIFEDVRGTHFPLPDRRAGQAHPPLHAARPGDPGPPAFGQRDGGRHRDRGGAGRRRRRLGRVHAARRAGRARFLADAAQQPRARRQPAYREDVPLQAVGRDRRPHVAHPHGGSRSTRTIR